MSTWEFGGVFAGRFCDQETGGRFDRARHFVRGLARIPLLVLLGTLVTGCPHSTEYVPKSTGKARLIIKNDVLALSKNGAAPEEREEWKTLLACDPEAASYAATADDEISSGRALAAVGGGLIILALIPGAIISSIGQKKIQEGHAALVDAVNVHNDSPACQSGAAAAPTPQPAQ